MRAATMVLGAALAVGGCGGEQPCLSTVCPAGYRPSAEVELVRDEHGITHVYGATIDDAYYGSGYAQARDQLFQMDLVRRRALGRRAEVLGADRLDDDVLVRTLGIPRWGAEAARRAAEREPASHRHVVAWTAGVNAFIDDVGAGRAPLPSGFAELGYAPERWEPADGYRVGKLILFGNANLIEYELFATVFRDLFSEVYATLPLYPPLTDAFILPPEERPPSGSEPLVGPGLPAARDRRGGRPPAEELARALASVHRVLGEHPRGASNNWAIDGRHTADGRPLMAGDPHQPLSSPLRMWLHHLASDDGAIDVIGWNFVGSPTVQLGHNRQVAWTATSSYPDTMDIIDVESDGATVTVDGVALPIEARSEQFGLPGGQSSEALVEEVPSVGVLLPSSVSPIPIVPPGRRLLLRWTGFAPTSEAQAFMAMDEAKTLDDLDAAIDEMEIGNFNFFTADAEGIRYRSAMAVPNRPPALGVEPFVMVPGAAASEAWGEGLLGDGALPSSRGGERGWLASANNDPFGFTADGSLLGDSHYFGVYFDPGTRAARIEAELTRLVARGDVNRADMETLQLDRVTLLADALLPLLVEAAARIDTDDALAAYRDRPELVALTEALAAWDRRMDRDSGPALAFHAFLWFSARRALGDDLNVLFDAIAEASGIYVLKWTVQTLTGAYAGAEELLQEGRDATLVGALADAADFLTARFGSTDPAAYRWGDLHVTRFSSIAGPGLDGAAVETDGADGTVNVASGQFFVGGEVPDRVENEDGAIYRMVTGFDEDGVPRTTFAMARGLSGEPSSPWWDNLEADWAAGRFRPLWFRRADVEAHTVDTETLRP